MGEIRTGRISSINPETGMARVVYHDKEQAVTAELPFLSLNQEYRMPKVNDPVLVAHLSNGSSRGAILGPYWNRGNKPHEAGKDLYRKDLSRIPGTALYRYDDGSGEYLLKAPDIEINAVDALLLDGPKTRIEANISIDIETRVLRGIFEELIQEAAREIVLRSGGKLILEDDTYQTDLKEIIEKIQGLGGGSFRRK